MSQCYLICTLSLARPQISSTETPPPPTESVLTSGPVTPPATPAIPSPTDHSLTDDPPVPVPTLTRSPSTDRPEGHIVPASSSKRKAEESSSEGSQAS